MAIVPPFVSGGITRVSDADVKSAGDVAVPGAVDHGTDTDLPDCALSVTLKVIVPVFSDVDDGWIDTTGGRSSFWIVSVWDVIPEIVPPADGLWRPNTTVSSASFNASPFTFTVTCCVAPFTEPAGNVTNDGDANEKSTPDVADPAYAPPGPSEEPTTALRSSTQHSPTEAWNSNCPRQTHSTRWRTPPRTRPHRRSGS